MEQNIIDSKKLLPLMVLVGFASGLVGGIVTDVFFFKNSQSQLVGGGNAVTQQVSYVEESQAINAIKKAGPSVVSIIASEDLKIYRNQPFRFYFGSPFSNDPFFNNVPGFQIQPKEQQDQKNNDKNAKDYDIQHQKIGGGSGFIISQDGMVLTNRHVVSRSDVQYSIITDDGNEYDGEVVSIDPLNDLAVLQMVKKGELSKKKEERTKLAHLSVIDFGDSSILEVGQKVLAIGYALGEYENTVTEGIISAKGRKIIASDGARGAETLSGLLQTDAAINPGNSGGPLVNLAGQVVGINVAIDATGSSIGFAIPMNEVNPILESIKKFGRIVRASIGVRHVLLNKDRAKQLKIDVDHGALLTGDEANGEFAVIPGSAADKAGLKMKDVVLSVNGKDINENYSLQAAVRDHKPGDQIQLKVWRSGNTLDVKVTLDEAKDQAVDLRAKV